MKNQITKKIERNFVGVLSIITSIVVLYISIIGPLCMNILTYKSSLSGVYQFIGQDLLNLVFVFPLLLIGGILLLQNKPKALPLLSFLPLYLIYYALSYAIGLEWGNTDYSGNSEHYIAFYIEIVVSSIIIFLYCIDNVKGKSLQFNRRSLIIYSIFAILFTLMFSLSYVKEISTNLVAPTDAYIAAPTLFWFVKTFDLSFTMPLMAISIYLLWSRPEKSYLMQLFSYGFFITMLSAVNCMAIVMFLYGDTAYSAAQHALFVILEVISISGYIFISKNTDTVKTN